MDFVRSNSGLYITSDTHFGHKNVIEYCNRPFSSIEEMDEIIIRNWNNVVRPGDTVIHLGDFALGPKGLIDEYLAALNGRILLMKGNHDRGNSFWRQFGDKVSMLPWGYKMLAGAHGYSGIIFSHRPMELNKVPEHYLNFHGHIHSTPQNPKFNTLPHIDCGVDYWDFRPVPIKLILDTMVGVYNG